MPVLSAAPKPQLKPDQFPVTWVHEARLNLDARPVVKGLIEQGAFAVIYGPPGSGKSFFTADIAQHIALGAPWRGRKCPQGLVVYVASEAGSSILKRFVGWRDNRVSDGLAKIPLAVLTRGPNLLDALQVTALADQMKELEQQAQLPLSLTVFDTLSRSIPGGDENSAEDMTRTVQAGDYLREHFNTATAYVHHSGKNPDQGARGHSSLHAAADLAIKVADNCATVEKVRDGVAGERFGFSLEPIEIGQDSDGDPVYTCLLNHTDAVATTKRSEPFGRNQKLFYTGLRTLIEEQGKPLPGTSAIPQGAKAVSYNTLVERLLPKVPDIKPFTARQRFSASAVALQEAGYIGVQGDWVWLTSP